MHQSYEFKPNSEIAKVKWLPLEKAMEKVTYSRDRAILEVFAELVKHQKLDTYAVVLLRHATAEPRGDNYPIDSKRPLADKGFGQAQLLVPTLTAYGAKSIITSDAERCKTTVDPFATREKIPVHLAHGLSQDNWDTGDLTELRDIVTGIIEAGDRVLLCSHRPVLPEIGRELALRSGSQPGAYLYEATSLPPAGFSVFHLSKKHPHRGVVSVEVYPLKHQKKI